MVSRRLFLAVIGASLLGVASLPAEEKKHEHDEKPGPNGGEIQELGDADDHHVEIKHDQANSKVTLWILSKDRKTAVTVKESPKINLKAKDGNKQIEMTAVKAVEGAASQWEAADAGFKADPLDGRIQVKLVDGKKYNVKLDAHHGHDH